MAKILVKSTADFLDELRLHFGCRSDYALEKIEQIGWSKQQISGYRNKHHAFDNATAKKIADLLEEDWGYVMCCMLAQRAKGDGERAMWHTLAGLAKKAARVNAKKVGTLMIAAIAVYFAPALLDYGHMTDAYAQSSSVYYVKSIIALWLAIELLIIVYAFDDNPAPNNKKTQGEFDHGHI